MSSRQPTASMPRQTCQTGAATLEEAIQSILGIGLRYDEWPAALRKQGYPWKPNLRGIMIKKEFEYFREEICCMRQEQRIEHRSKVKSNSLNSIVKRLKGKSVAGLPAEKEKRLQAHRLLSKDAQSNTLRGYIKEWDEEDALRIGSPIAKTNDQQLTNLTTSSSELGTPQYHSATDDSSQNQYSTEPQPGPNPDPHYDTEMTDDAYLSVFDDRLQHPSSNTTSLLYSGQYPSLYTNIDPALIQIRDAAQFLRHQSDWRSQSEGNFSSTRQPTPRSRSDAEMSSIFLSRVNNYAQITDSLSAEYSQEVGLHEPDPSGFTMFDMTAESETYPDLEETGIQVTQWTEPPPHERTFYDHSESVLINETSATNGRTSEENISVDAVEQPISSSDFTDVSSKPAPAHHTRKRRRQDKHGNSSESLECSTIEAENFTSSVIVDQDSMAKCPASSETSIKSIFSGMRSATSQLKASNTRLNNNRITMLEEELEKEKAYRQKEKEDHQKTKEALDVSKADHQKTKEALDLSNQMLQPALAEIQYLREQIQKLQMESKRTSQEYDGLARNLIQDKIIQEANLGRQRHMPHRAGSSLLQNSTEVEDLYRTRPPRGLRPLSLMQITTSNETAAPQIRSPTSQTSPIPLIRLPIATGPTSRFGSAAATSRTCNSRGSSPIPSGGVAALTPANHTGQTRPASADSCTAQNINTAIKNGYQQLKHKISKEFTSRPGGKEKSNTDHPSPTRPGTARSDTARPDAALPDTAQPDPAELNPVQPTYTLPPFSASVPLERQMMGILIDGANRGTNYTDDSGYDSIELDRYSRAPPEDPF